MKGFNISIQGFSHISKGLVCQDSSGFYCDDNISIAVVADGHGSQKHFRSDIGSKMAVQIAINSVKDFIKDKTSFNEAIKNNSNKVLTRIESNIVYNWNNSINEHYNNNPVCEEEIAQISKDELAKISIESMYGSTLIVAAMTNQYWFGMQIGDGSCVSLYQDGETKLQIPSDDRLIANLTTSLCDCDAIHNFRHYYSDNIPIALLVSTDGLSSSFFDENTFLTFNRRIISQMTNYDFALESLKQHLYKRSKEGSYDDISISAIYKDDIDFEAIKVKSLK